MHYAFDLKTLRKKLNLTQSQLAEKIGVNLATVWRWENEGIPQRGTARAYLDQLAKEVAQ